MPPRDKIVEAIIDLDELVALELADEMIKSGTNPVEILERCRKGMSIVGEKFERRLFSVGDDHGGRDIQPDHEHRQATP